MPSDSTLIHLWENGTLSCGTVEPIIQSSSDPLKVTCPACRVPLVKKPPEVQQPEPPKYEFWINGRSYWTPEPIWKGQQIKDFIKAPSSALLFVEQSENDPDVQIHNGDLVAVSQNHFYTKDRIEAPEDSFAKVKRAVEEFVKTDAKALYDDYRSTFFEFEKRPCPRCKGSGIDPEFYNNDLHTGEPVPAECEECRFDW